MAVRQVRLLVAFLWTLLVGMEGVAIAELAPPEHQQLARQIVRSAGVKAGLLVCLGCEDGRLAAGLAEEGNFVVHGLALDRTSMKQARDYIQAKGLYGRVSIEAGSLAKLPLADNIVNLVVADNLPGLLARGLSLQEIARVLCPGGVAYLGQSLKHSTSGQVVTEDMLRTYFSRAGMRKVEVVKHQGIWAKAQKTRPGGMDEWTHKAYDAGGNCVSEDKLIAPLSSMRWIAGPVWPMGTGYQVSGAGVLSANGRLFAVTLNVVDNFRSTPQQRDHRWFLIARDAYNGMLLWQRPFNMDVLRDGQELARAVVAVGDRLYVVLGGKTVTLDAASGKTLATFAKDTPVGTRLLHVQGLLIVADGQRIRALDGISGELRWEKQAATQDIVAGASRVFYTTSHQRQLVCLDLYTGRKRWQSDLESIVGFKEQLLFYKSGVVVFVWELDWHKGQNGIAVFTAEDGKELWRSEYVSSRATWANTVWFVNGLIWHRVDKAGLQGVNPQTGKVEKKIVMKGGYCGGCCRDIATSRYAVSTRPLNFFDWEDGSCYGFRGGRHGCRAGVIVANGLLYTLPHGCKCVREALHGYIAFAPSAERAENYEQLELTGRLKRAREVSLPTEQPNSSPRDNWSTFRHDSRRTSSTTCKLPRKLELDWQVQVSKQDMPRSSVTDDWSANPLGGDRLTAPVVVEDVAFVGVVDEHRIVAIDGNTGISWSFTAGGRLDVPPTIYKGLCLFGAHDGWVYCLRANDGELLWRFRAAPGEKRILAFGQLESPWPVIGGVMVEDDTAYFTAGRTSPVDGGIYGYALDVRTGSPIWAKRLAAAESDILAREGSGFRIAGGGSAGIKFDLKTGNRLPEVIRAQFKWDYSGDIGTFWGGPNRTIDHTWRILSVNETASHWMRIKQGYGPHEGQLVIGAPDGERFFAYRFKQVHWSKAKDSSTEFGGNLLAWKGKEQIWSVDVPEDFQVEALVLAGDTLFAAGPADRFHRSPGAKLWALSAEDGRTLGEYKLNSPPVCEGMAAAGGRLYLATQDGKLLCFGKGFVP